MIETGCVRWKYIWQGGNLQPFQDYAFSWKLHGVRRAWSNVFLCFVAWIVNLLSLDNTTDCVLYESVQCGNFCTCHWSHLNLSPWRNLFSMKYRLCLFCLVPWTCQRLPAFRGLIWESFERSVYVSHAEFSASLSPKSECRAVVSNSAYSPALATPRIRKMIKTKSLI